MKTLARRMLIKYLERHPFLCKAALDKQGFIGITEYPFKSTQRYGYGKPPHPLLFEIINSNRSSYENILRSFFRFRENIIKIPPTDQGDSARPFWMNNWLPPLDALSLYCLVATFKPRRYVEVGSGTSTKFARRSIIDHELTTNITSIDPQPRSCIENICDEVIRAPLQEVDLRIFEQMEAKDILFIDGSHRCFMNSDVTVTFLDILPRLPAGVLVHYHDIFLPYDYPPSWEPRYYSEQYLLAIHLLGNTPMFSILLPNYFVSTDPLLKNIMLALIEEIIGPVPKEHLPPPWGTPELAWTEKNGVSFWLKTNGGSLFP